MTRVLLAPDKFKGTLTASEVAAGITAGIRSVEPDVEIVTVPVADGGDGTVAAAVSAGFATVPAVATGPTGVPVHTSYARLGTEAVIELAAVSGLAQLPDGEPAPLTATSRGTGELIAAALDAGCTRIVLGVGGSAGTDGGAGMLAALGARIIGASGAALADGGGALESVTALDLSRLHPRLSAAEIVLASDVDNPLTGPNGAAAVYGPQKGADQDQVRRLDRNLQRWASVVTAATGVDQSRTPGAGAAGGVGYAAIAVLRARVEPGVAVVLGLTGFEAALIGTDLVITGEGSLDEQTLRGKAPAGVAAAARAAGVPVVAVAGRCTLDEPTLRAAGIDVAFTLTDEADRPDQPFTDPGTLLERIGARIGRRLATLDEMAAGI